MTRWDKKCPIYVSHIKLLKPPLTSQASFLQTLYTLCEFSPGHNSPPGFRFRRGGPKEVLRAVS